MNGEIKWFDFQNDPTGHILWTVTDRCCSLSEDVKKRHLVNLVHILICTLPYPHWLLQGAGWLFIEIVLISTESLVQIPSNSALHSPEPITIVVNWLDERFVTYV